MAAAPFEPSGDARAFALSQWNTYRAHVDVGFTPEQAMQIILGMFYSACISNAINPNQSD